MTPETRQRVVLGVLTLVLMVVVGRMLIGGGGSSGRTAGGGRVGDDQGAIDARVETVRLADLDLEPATFELGRDPFRFAPKPAPPPVPVAPPPQPPPRQQPRQQAPVAAAPQPPPVDVVYLGRFGPTAGPLAVFSDGNEIFNVRQGGVLKEHFMVDKIGFESADLKFVGFPNVPATRLPVGGKS